MFLSIGITGRLVSGHILSKVWYMVQAKAVETCAVECLNLVKTCFFYFMINLIEILLKYFL